MALTGRRREALGTERAMGHFDWSLAHTAEEVAERLDISSATAHDHLRAAQPTLVGSVFGAGSVRVRPATKRGSERGR